MEYPRASVQTMPVAHPLTRLVECHWNAVSVNNSPSYFIPTDWTSGVYLAKLTANASGKQRYIIFVVRDNEAIAVPVSDERNDISSVRINGAANLSTVPRPAH